MLLLWTRPCSCYNMMTNRIDLKRCYTSSLNTQYINKRAYMYLVNVQLLDISKMIFASFGRQKTDVDKLCISQDARGIQLGSRVFGDCDSLLSQIMQHLMNRDDLRKWEMERTVRMRAYDKKRTKSWSNSHYLSILLRHTLYNFHTSSLLIIYASGLSFARESVRNNSRQATQAISHRSTDIRHATCDSRHYGYLHVILTLTLACHLFFVHPHGFLRKRDCSQSIISLRESVLNVKGKKLNALLRSEQMNRDFYHLHVPVKWSSSNITELFNFYLFSIHSFLENIYILYIIFP